MLYNVIMQNIASSTIKKLKYIPVTLFSLLTLWFIYFLLTNHDSSSQGAQLWAVTYQIIAWFGAITGLYFSRFWGGKESVMGRANLAFAIGLLAQSLGQSIFSFYFFKGIEAPYPSLADVGFFGSIPLYIYGVILLGRASGVRFSFKSYRSKISAFIIPALILALSYIILLKNYEFDWSSPLTVILDFGYPLGQALYISLALVVYLLTRNYLGGMLKKPILLFIFALLAQYIADYVFLFQISRDTYTGGLGVDFLYLMAYFIMALALINLGSSYKKIVESK